MKPDSSPMRTWPTLIKALAVYGAGAWVAVEVVGFLTSTYSLPRAIVDLAIVLAGAGGLSTAVITWYHAEPGTQKAPLTEKLILGGLTVTTIVIATLVVARDPARQFHRTRGPRLVIEMPLPPPEESDVASMHWAPPDRTVSLPVGWFVLDPDWFRLDAPGLTIRLEGHPVMYQEAADSEFGGVTVVLPAIPSMLRSLLEGGEEHQTGLVELGGFSLRIERPFTLSSYGDSIVVRLEGRFRPEETASDSVEGGG